MADFIDFILLIHILTIQYTWEDHIEGQCCGAEI
jgi:hypothetical protein